MFFSTDKQLPRFQQPCYGPKEVHTQVIISRVTVGNGVGSKEILNGKKKPYLVESMSKNETQTAESLSSQVRAEALYMYIP